MTLKVGIIGGGIGGLSCASLLARDGFNVTILERFSKPHPVGAGVLVQPTGLRVLQQMGLLDTLESSSACIRQLIGTNQRGHRVMDVDYARLNHRLHGLGVHRGTLFDSLFTLATEAGASLVCDAEISAFKERGNQVVASGPGGEFGPYDLIIIASGTQSKLRSQLPIRQRFRPFPWGAIWCMCPLTDERHAGVLHQYYHRADGMMGILPTGIHPATGQSAASFFWSLKVSRYSEWIASDFDQWRQHCYRQWPKLEGLLDTLVDHQSLQLARYGDVVMRQWHHGRVVCIGDAAHGMSPQLGQGVNLALIDAWVLARCLKNSEIPEALADYSRIRRRHLKFYQRCSRLLTPMFQSNSRLAPVIRDLGFRIARKISLLDREAIRTVSGLKTGLIADRSVEILGGKEW